MLVELIPKVTFMRVVHCLAFMREQLCHFELQNVPALWSNYLYPNRNAMINLGFFPIKWTVHGNFSIQTFPY